MKALLSTPGFIEAFFALAGILFGFILSEWSTSRRESRNEKKQAQASRAIISLEIDLNLELLQEFWLPATNRAEDEKKSQDEQKVALAHKFIQIPVPEWSREVFSSQLPLITSTLQSQEVVKVFQFYERLRRLETIRGELVLAGEIQRTEFLAATKKDSTHNFGKYVELAYSPATPFNKKAKDTWKEYESLVAQLVAKGNPLKPQRLNSR